MENKTSGRTKNLKTDRIDTAHKAVFFADIMNQQAPEAPVGLVYLEDKYTDQDYHPAHPDNH